MSAQVMGARPPHRQVPRPQALLHHLEFLVMVVLEPEEVLEVVVGVVLLAVVLVEVQGVVVEQAVGVEDLEVVVAQGVEVAWEDEKYNG